MMASNCNPDPPTAPGSDSDGRRDNTTADTDPHKDMDKEPSDLSGCRPGNKFVSECQYLLKGETSWSEFQKCKKNPGHKNFIQLRNFTKDHLPEEMRREDVMVDIKERADRTVHIHVPWTSKDRPAKFANEITPYPGYYFKDTRVPRNGTGFVTKWSTQKDYISGDCPCHPCRISKNPEKRYWAYRVCTATHVVFDDVEVEHTVITLFYDSEVESEDVKLYGVELASGLSQEQRHKSDICDGLVCVTHSEESVKKIEGKFGGQRPPFTRLKKGEGIFVSHPHGGPKMLTVGKMLYKTILIEPGDIRSYTLPKDAICYVSSDSNGGLVRYKTPAACTIPDDAEYRVRWDYNKNGFTFPPRTKFLSEDRTAIKIKDGAISTDYFFFMTSDLDFLNSSFPLLEHNDRPIHMSYDTPTCPGSSGAALCMIPYNDIAGDRYILSDIPHSVWDEQEGFGQSSCISYDIDETLQMANESNGARSHGVKRRKPGDDIIERTKRRKICENVDVTLEGTPSPVEGTG